MITFSLQSGSNGNAIYVEAGAVKLLFDGGISGRQARARMAARGRDIREVDALILSHDHRDHVQAAGIYQRKFGLPIYVTRRTFQAVEYDVGRVRNVRFFRAGDSLAFNGIVVHTIRTPHDAVDGVVFVVEHEGKRLAILTDLGHPFAGLQHVLEAVDAAYLESNYDPQMLAEGPYPGWLKTRIAGSGGHLSNPEAAELLRGCGRRRPRWVAIAHLSEQNNDPELALETNRAAVGRSYPFHVASRYGVSPILTV
jgi:phosphoribosyl 1,2-cyclic phosphodiesterase